MENSDRTLREALLILVDAVQKDLQFFPDAPHKESALGIALEALAATEPAKEPV